MGKEKAAACSSRRMGQEGREGGQKSRLDMSRVNRQETSTEGLLRPPSSAASIQLTVQSTRNRIFFLQVRKPSRNLAFFVGERGVACA